MEVLANRTVETALSAPGKSVTPTCQSGPVRVAILGAVLVTDDGRPVEVGGARLRALLTRLALEPGRAVGVQTLKAMTASKVYLGGTASVVTSWSVPAGNRYLGQVQFKDGTNAVLGTSLIAVDVH